MVSGKTQTPYRFFFKTSFAWREEKRMLRICKVVWANRIGPNRPGGYSALVSISLQPRLFYWRCYHDDSEVTIFGVRFRYLKNHDLWLG